MRVLVLYIGTADIWACGYVCWMSFAVLLLCSSLLTCSTDCAGVPRVPRVLRVLAVLAVLACLPACLLTPRKSVCMRYATLLCLLNIVELVLIIYR